MRLPASLTALVGDEVPLLLYLSIGSCAGSRFSMDHSSLASVVF